MKRAVGCLSLLLLGVVGLLVGGHWWAIRGIENSLRESIQDEAGYPPLIKGFTGLLPLGKFSLDSMQVKADIEGALLELQSGSVQLHLSPPAFLSDRYEIRSLRIPLLKTEFNQPDQNARVWGDVKIEASSSAPGPADAPEGTLWAEALDIQASGVKGSLSGKEWELINLATLRAVPFQLVPEIGVAGPMDFDLRGRLTPDDQGDLFFAKGAIDATGARFDIDAGLSALRFPTRIPWIDPLLSEEEGVVSSDFIQSGSLSYRLTGKLEGDVFKGAMILRAHQPKFGTALRDLAKEASESIPVDLNLLLDAIESRTETIEIGPFDLDENLATPEIESAPLLLGGLTRELFKLSTGGGGDSPFNLFQRPKE